MTEESPDRKPRNPDRRESSGGGSYNPGGQAGESVQSGGQRPADEPGGPFLGKAAGKPRNQGNPGETGSPGGKGKQEAPRNQKR
jgi:hypothetical protein